MTQLRPGHAGAPWRLPGSWGSRGQGARRTEGPSRVQAQPRPPTSPEDPGVGGGRGASGRWSPATVEAAEVLESGWLGAGSGPLLPNFCPAPTWAHHPRLRPQPLGPARESAPCRGRGSKEREWNWAASQKSECVCKLVFSKKLSGTCVFGDGGGEGGSVEKEQDPFFLPGPRLPRSAVSLKR